MKPKQFKSLMLIAALVAVTGVALAYMRADTMPGASTAAGQPILSVNARLVQNKVLTGSDGRITVALDLTAGNASNIDDDAVMPVDMVIVLDRSGSMGGAKITDARRAIRHLIDGLGHRDRLALVSYANGARIDAPLSTVDAHHRRQLMAAVDRIRTGGGTNLGAGLDKGIRAALKSGTDNRGRKLILISDGLANQGMTHPNALAAMAAGGYERHLAVSTVGVGYDFNEQLMTRIADHGGGSYHFLEDPSRFARVILKEFQHTRQTVADNVVIFWPQADGVRLIQAGGYPVTMRGATAIVRPGGFLSGQQRTLYLTFQVPTGQPRDFALSAFQIAFEQAGKRFKLSSTEPLQVACVADPKAVMSSIDKKSWTDKVVREDYNQLKEEVAADIRKGEKKKALERISAYTRKQTAVNRSVGSARVARNLDTEVRQLESMVADTFAGKPAAVAAKQRQNAKKLQYQGYQGRRSKN